MANIKVNTQVVNTAAGGLRTINNQIRDGFQNVQNTVTSLGSSWDGSASTVAISKFNEIKSKFFDARYTVLDNYVNFLLHQVDEGYTQTENANTSLADQFK